MNMLRTKPRWRERQKNLHRELNGLDSFNTLHFVPKDYFFFRAKDCSLLVSPDENSVSKMCK